MKRFLHLFLMLVTIIIIAPSRAGDVVEDPLERQMLEIAKDLRCAVCQNQPVSESNSDLARDMRVIIREQLVAGKNREEIMGYFVDRYGNYVLMKPAFDMAGSLIWLAPLLLFAALAAGAWTFLRNRQRAAPPAAPELSAEDRARVQAAEAEDKASIENSGDGS